MEKDFTFNVQDRQALKVTEDAIIDLQIIITTLLNVVKGVRKYCKKCCEAWCQQEWDRQCACNATLEELDDHAEDVELCIERAKSLKDRVTSSVQLVSKCRYW